jgi:prepilin-type N-terminal cleavage/methylation domain-containing protein
MKRRTGFTLIELVVVVMILGLLVAIAAPRMMNIMGGATDNSARMSLEVLRDAIETYAANNAGAYPGTDEATFKSLIGQYLRGPFPRCPVGSGTADGVDVVGTGAALSGTGGDGSAGTNMWKYDYISGEIIINYNANSETGLPYDEL